MSEGNVPEIRVRVIERIYSRDAGNAGTAEQGDDGIRHEYCSRPDDSKPCH